MLDNLDADLQRTCRSIQILMVIYFVLYLFILRFYISLVYLLEIHCHVSEAYVKFHVCLSHSSPGISKINIGHPGFCEITQQTCEWTWDQDYK